MGGARKGAVARVGASAHVLRARGRSNPARHAPAGRGPGFCLQTPSLRVSFSGRRHRSQVPQVPPHPHRLCGHFVGTGGCQRSPDDLFWGCATSGQLSPCHSDERENGTTESCLYRDSGRLSLLFMRGIINLRASHRYHIPQPLFRHEQRLHRCSEPLCFQNRSPPLTPSGPAQQPASFTKPRSLPSPSLLVLTLTLTLHPIILKRDCGATQPPALAFSIAVTREPIIRVRRWRCRPQLRRRSLFCAAG